MARRNRELIEYEHPDLDGYNSFMRHMEKNGFLPNNFVFTLKSKRGHPWENRISGDLCLAANDERGKTLKLVRGERYFFTFSPSTHVLYFTADPLGGPEGLPLPQTGTPFQTFKTISFIVNSSFPPLFYYQDRHHPYLGGAIMIMDPPHSTTKRKPESVRGKRPEPTRERKLESVRERKPESVRERKPESVRERKPESVRERKPESVRERKPESVKERKPESVRERKPESAREKRRDHINIPYAGEQVGADGKLHSKPTGKVLTLSLSNSDSDEEGEPDRVWQAIERERKSHVAQEKARQDKERTAKGQADKKGPSKERTDKKGPSKERTDKKGPSKGRSRGETKEKESTREQKSKLRGEGEGESESSGDESSNFMVQEGHSSQYINSIVEYEFYRKRILDDAIDGAIREESLYDLSDEPDTPATLDRYYDSEEDSSQRLIDLLEP